MGRIKGKKKKNPQSNKDRYRALLYSLSPILLDALMKLIQGFCQVSMTLETIFGSCYILFLEYLNGLLKILKGLLSRRTACQRQQKAIQKQLWIGGCFF